MTDSFANRNSKFAVRLVRHSKFVIRHCPHPHDATGRLDFVLANPPFNVNAVDTAMRVSARRHPEGTPQDLPARQDHERLKDMVGPGHRFPFGLPRTDNATATRVSAKPKLAKPDRRSLGETELHYLWIQLFHSALKNGEAGTSGGRAGFVMANSASDARSSEQELRRQLIESRAVDVMVAGGPNLFYTVTLPCTLWFFDKAKAALPPPSTRPGGHPSPTGRRDGDEGKQNRADTVLFIDARHIYRQVDRAHREWTPAQIGFLANLVRLYRGEALDFTLGGDEARAKLEEIFGLPSTSGRRAGDEVSPPTYRDVPGLCKAAKIEEIAANGWSLNPGRYVGVAAGEAVSDEDFKEQLETLNEELETLNAQARALEQTIAGNVAEILEA